MMLKQASLLTFYTGILQKEKRAQNKLKMALLVQKDVLTTVTESGNFLNSAYFFKKFGFLVFFSC